MRIALIVATLWADYGSPFDMEITMQARLSRTYGGLQICDDALHSPILVWKFWEWVPHPAIAFIFVDHWKKCSESVAIADEVRPRVGVRILPHKLFFEMDFLQV